MSDNDSSMLEKAAAEALEEERQRLEDIADRLRGLLDARDRRLAELEEQLERVMQGSRSVSAEHDYLVEQIEELKRDDSSNEIESMNRRDDANDDRTTMSLSATNASSKFAAHHDRPRSGPAGQDRRTSRTGRTAKFNGARASLGSPKRTHPRSGRTSVC